MKAPSTPRFDIDALRRRVGEKRFARGESCHRGGKVVLVSIEPEHILAQVEGSASSAAARLTSKITPIWRASGL